MSKFGVNQPILEEWIEKTLAVPDALFFPIDDYEVEFSDPLYQSKAGMGFFLKAQVDPYEVIEAARWKARGADPGEIDLLRIDYEAQDLRLTLWENINFVMLRTSPLDGVQPEPERRRAWLAGLIDKVVQTDTEDHDWRFTLPDDLDRSWEPRLISNDGAIPVAELQTRHDRADILIREGAILFFFYKLIAQRMGLPPADEWFGPEARAAVKK